ncbi:dynactin subunit 2-like [Lineus longissimus]|uniref:dynactin subunit 2-like n=1 Tax=Lineus longissimus TaxID=88925 RepID=UPI002B4F1623
MASDPKYAQLPGIARDQPDVYESGDLPESDQSKTPEELDSESVEKIPINVGESFTKFKGKQLDSSGLDFSDKISRSRRTGYVVQSEYEIVGEREAETPLQKYQRIQHEIRELADEVNKLKDGMKDTSKDEISPVQLAQQTEFLHHQLADLHLESILGSEAKVDLADPQGALQKRLLNQIEMFKQMSMRAKSPGKGKSPERPAGGDQITYELFYKPEQAKFANTARMADLEQRLERLEAVIGQNPEKLSSLTKDAANKSLVGAVVSLTAKTSLFDPDQLDQIEGRMVGLLQKLNSIAEKKDVVEDCDKQTKITALYDVVKKWESIAGSVPHILDRLVALKELHEQALQFSQALTHLDTSQQQIDTSLKSHGDMLKQLQSNFQENMTTIQGNCSSLDQRLKVVKK